MKNTYNSNNYKNYQQIRGCIIIYRYVHVILQSFDICHDFVIQMKKKYISNYLGFIYMNIMQKSVTRKKKNIKPHIKLIMCNIARRLCTKPANYWRILESTSQLQVYSWKNVATFAKISPITLIRLPCPSLYFVSFVHAGFFFIFFLIASHIKMMT